MLLALCSNCEVIADSLLDASEEFLVNVLVLLATWDAKVIGEEF